MDKQTGHLQLKKKRQKGSFLRQARRHAAGEGGVRFENGERQNYRPTSIALIVRDNYCYAPISSLVHENVGREREREDIAERMFLELGCLNIGHSDANEPAHCICCSL